jgi:hypothetical protein
MNGNDEFREDAERISLRRLDLLMAGELPEADASALREAVSNSPEAILYLEKYSQARSGLTLGKLRASAGKPDPSGHPLPAARRLWQRFRELLFPAAPRGLGFALGGLAIMGLGILTWQSQHSDGGIRSEDGKFQSKGLEGTAVRLVIRSAEIEPGELAQAKPGDTLAVSYRSAGPVRAQIWYQEDKGEPAAMSGESATLDWVAAMGWRLAPERIILDGEWKRQTVWVIWSEAPFTAEDAKKALAGSQGRSDLHAEVFRLVNPG